MPHDVCGVTVESAQGWESWRLMEPDGDYHHYLTSIVINIDQYLSMFINVYQCSSIFINVYQN
jgi:hypothetical protein